MTGRAFEPADLAGTEADRLERRRPQLLARRRDLGGARDALGRRHRLPAGVLPGLLESAQGGFGHEPIVIGQPFTVNRECPKSVHRRAKIAALDTTAYNLVMAGLFSFLVEKPALRREIARRDWSG